MRHWCRILIAVALPLALAGDSAWAASSVVEQGKRYALELADGSALRGTVSFAGTAVALLRLDSGVVRQLERGEVVAARELPAPPTAAGMTTTTVAASGEALGAGTPSPQAQPIGAGTWELRFGTGASVSVPGLNLSPAGQSGLGVLFGSGSDDSLTLFGLNLGMARYLNANAAIGFLLDLGVASYRSSTITAVGFSPLLRGLSWLSKRANVFAELQLGYSGIFQDRGSLSFLRVGVNVGAEYLVGASWGFRVWTGFGALVGVGDTKGNLYEIPLRWGIAGYF